MSIDIETEQVLTLTAATKLLPNRRGGKKPHVSTLYRWALRGIKGVQLETIPIGGSTCTSREALQRFFDRLQTARRKIDSTPQHPSKTANALERLERQLRGEGF
ncbi:MAG TPA: DUF1580 domain-containing protein [Pirellulales bacterium]|jgi:hypothetical protein|nr:DUF1580 domain-containing protein [Pirellulales bacterium]